MTHEDRRLSNGTPLPLLDRGTCTETTSQRPRIRHEKDDIIHTYLSTMACLAANAPKVSTMKTTTASDVVSHHSDET
jgi:hypothetical protein